MLRSMTLEELFSDAPYFRAHEGMLNARHRIKNPNDPNSPGLWFVDRDQVLEIASQKSTNYDSRNRDTARADYDFKMVHVKVRDVVIDYHINFEGSRLGWHGQHGDRSKGKLSPSMYQCERQNGALIQYYIPKDRFHTTFEWDEVGRFYCQKPYQIKFIDKNLMLDMQDGQVEQIYAGCEVLRQGRSLVVRKPSVLYGSDVRLICRQPLSFYINEFHEFEQLTSAADHSHGIKDLALLAGSLGYGLSTTVCSGEMSRNPYGILRDLYNLAASTFSEAGMILSREQQDEFRNHVRDIEVRHHYFQVNPGAFTLER